MDIPLSLVLFGGYGHPKATEQGRCGGNVLASSGEPWEIIVIFHDPPLYIAGLGSCAPLFGTVALDLLFELSALPFHLVARLVELSLPGLQLLQP